MSFCIYPNVMYTLLQRTLLLLLLCTGTVQSQPLPSAERLVRLWMAGQHEAMDRIDHVQGREEGTLVLDGPLGQHRLEYTTTLDGLPRSGQWAHQLERARLNDRVIPPRRIAAFERRMHEQFKPVFQHTARFIPSPTRLLNLLRPHTAPVVDVLDGVRALRFEALLKPRAQALNRQGRAEVERVTLWFSDTDTPVLLQARIILRPRQNPASTILHTTYTTLDGLAVPASFRLEGTIQQKRRLRTFTTLVDLSVAYTY